MEKTKILIKYDLCNEKIYGIYIPIPSPGVRRLDSFCNESTSFAIDNIGRVEIAGNDDLLHTSLTKEEIEHTLTRYFGEVEFTWSKNTLKWLD